MVNNMAQKWLLFEEEGWQIIIPETDIEAHANNPIKGKKNELAGFTCPCEPKIDYLNKKIIHNSFLDKERIESSVVNLYENKDEFDLI